MKAQDLKVGQRIRVGSADGQILSLAGDNGWLIQFPIFMEGISFAILDAIGFEVIEPSQIRCVVNKTHPSYFLSETPAVTLNNWVENEMLPGETWDIVATRRVTN